MRKFVVVLAVVLVAFVAGACGGSDDGDGGSGEGSATGGQSSGGTETPEVASCTFAPADTPSGVTAGYVTLEGSNDTGSQADSTQIRFELLDASGERAGDEQNWSITLWPDGEEIAYVVPILTGSTEPGAYAAVASCEVLDVQSGQFAEKTSYDHTGATCEIVQPGGRIGGPDIQFDISGVSDRPESDELFTTIGVYDGDVRVSTGSASIEPGATTGTASFVATGDSLTCKLLELRVP